MPPQPCRSLLWHTGPKEAVDCVQDCGGVSVRTIKNNFFKQRIKQIATLKKVSL